MKTRIIIKNRIIILITVDECDQCGGLGWVRIEGRVNGYRNGYQTVTECMACNPTGKRPYVGLPTVGPLP